MSGQFFQGSDKMPARWLVVVLAGRIVGRAGCAVEVAMAAEVVTDNWEEEREARSRCCLNYGTAWRLHYKSSVPDVTFFGNKRCCDWDTYFCPFFPHVEMCFTHNPEAQSSRSPTKPSLPGMAFLCAHIPTEAPHVHAGLRSVSGALALFGGEVAEDEAAKVVGDFAEAGGREDGFG